MIKRNLRLSVLSLFYIALILHGLQRISGLFIIELSKIKSISYQDAATPFIYSWAVAKIVASFSDFIIDDKSSELVVFCGVLLSSMGAALCILDTDIITITVFWGFIFGSGYGLASPHLTRDLSNMDTDKLAFLKEIPSSFGIFIMPFLLNILIVQFGIQGSFIMFSGIILQYIPFAFAAIYNINIRIPNINWRVRKKINQYSVSKQDGQKGISSESFNSSLEPDFVLKTNQNDYYRKINIENIATSSRENFRVGRKRSETRGNVLKGLEIDRKKLQIYTTHSTIPEKKSSENIGKIFEENFSRTHVTDVQPECKELKNLSILNSKVIHKLCKPNKSSFNNNKHDCDLENPILENISELEIKKTECKKEELNDIGLENYLLNEQMILAHASTEISSLSTHEEKDHNKHQIRENPETERRVSFISKQAENISNGFRSEKVFDKKTSVLSHQTIKNTPIFSIPLNIKVHVEEYTLTEDKECMNNSFDSNYSIDKISEELNYSKTKFQKSKYINSASQTSKITKGNFDDKSRLSDIYSISNKLKFNNKRYSKKNSKTIDLNCRKDKLKLKFERILKFFNKTISPVCLCILVITIIFETSLITLLTNIGDFVNTSYDFKWILVSFGIGGFFGKLCCYKISKTMSEKSHTVGIILFLLTGLSIAGVLYSPNLNWLAGFYSILGALDGGISYILPKFIFDYTHKDVHHIISSMKSFLSGIAIICLPSIRGLLPEEMGDYEFLLQTLSCLSVLCALVAYFLPYLRNISNKRISISFKEILDRA